jgi:hypothetical protein
MPRTVYVVGAAPAAGVTTFNTRSGAVTPANGDYTVAQVTGAAPLASPALTGTPTAPTQAPGTNNTDIATTAYVDAKASGFSIVSTRVSSTTSTGNLAGGTELALAWPINVFNDLGAWSTGANTRLTVPASGLYRLSALVEVNFTGINSNNFAQVFIQKNGARGAGAKSIAYATCDATGGSADEVSLLDTGEVKLTAGDFYEVTIIPNIFSGNVLALINGAVTSFFNMTRLT